MGWSIEQELEEHVAREAFAPLIRSWRVQKPGTWIYGFDVTWFPGCIFLSGDLGELTLAYHQAMHTFDDTVPWIAGSHCDYLLEKSSAKQEYDPERTIRALLDLAEEYMRDWDDQQFWEACSKLAYCSCDDTPEGIKQYLLKNALNFSEQDIYEATGGSELLYYSWPQRSKNQIAALQRWAELV